MKKSEKINILDDLIERTEKLEYQGKESINVILNETLSFVRNALENKVNAMAWEKNIDEIKWTPSITSTSTMGRDYENSWLRGRKVFYDILVSIKKEVAQYTPDENEIISYENSENDNNTIIFISHSSSDKLYGNALRDFITGLGIKNGQLIYTSHPLHGIPLDVNIYEYLRKNIYKNIFMIFLWSDKYLDSPACLNEMGAAWVVQSDYTNIYTPSFDFENPKYHECAIDTQKMGAVLNGDDNCKSKMIEVKNKILSIFGLEVDEKTTSYLIDKFIKEILEIPKNG